MEIKTLSSDQLKSLKVSNKTEAGERFREIIEACIASESRAVLVTLDGKTANQFRQFMFYYADKNGFKVRVVSCSEPGKVVVIKL